MFKLGNIIDSELTVGNLNLVQFELDDDVGEGSRQTERPIFEQVINFLLIRV